MFKEGKNADTENPPEPLDTEEMRQAMAVLRRFSKNEKDYLLYQSRLDAVLTYNIRIGELEDARKEKELAQKEKELALERERQAQEKVKNLLLLSKKKGIDPEEPVS